MNLLSRIYYAFAPYANQGERSVAKFFASLSEHDTSKHTRERLNELLQSNIALINLWSEYRYKGYKYLRKSERKKLYANLDAIAADFERFRVAAPVLASADIARFHHAAHHETANTERAYLIRSLMNYFSPTRGLYEYRASSSFGRLLRDPAQGKLVGDCNQIVTLYIYLYSRYFDVSDLKVRLLPGHVALHYGGVDIETTNGTLADYSSKQDAELLPIEEIVSVNLLDTTDAYLATHEVAAEDFLQAARFAFILSHDRDIVTRNLDAAYGLLINSLMKRHSYHQALKIARASRNIELIRIVGHNGALHHLQQHDFKTARRFATHAPDPAKLTRECYHAEGAYHFNAKRYRDAIKAFEKSGDRSLVASCYEALFFTEQNKLGTNVTTANVKSHAGTIKRMRTYAKKSGNKKLVQAANDLNKYL